MGKSIPVDLGVKKFRSKSDARDYFQQMLHSYANGDKVKKADAALLVELLRRHPDARLKIGPGIKHFEVDEADFATQCFYVYRVDGTHDNFSLHTCVDQPV